MNSFNLPPLLAADNPLDHVIDHPLWQVGNLWIISNATVMLVLAAIITTALVIPAARRITTGSKRESLDDFQAHGLFANLIETICVYLRDQVFRPVLHEQTDRFAPMLWTLFFFILINNMLGLVPLLDITAGIGALIGVPIGYRGHGIGGTATQSIWVTGALAAIAFIYWNAVAMRKDFKGWALHLTAGAPVYMWIIMVPVELLGSFVKPVALAVRLFANMTGGHILLAVVLGFITQIPAGLGTGAVPLSIVPLLGAVAIYLLEILVGFIQAFIFVFLTTIFLGQLVVHEHEDHDTDEVHEHLPHATPEGVDEPQTVPLGNT